MTDKIERWLNDRTELAELRKRLSDTEKEVAVLKDLLYHSEQFRQAYRIGKLKLYEMGGEVQKAAAEHLPCSEGPLESAAVEALGHRTGWIAIKRADDLRDERDDARKSLALCMEERDWHRTEQRKAVAELTDARKELEAISLLARIEALRDALNKLDSQSSEEAT